MTATPLPDLEEIVEVSLQPASALLEEPTPTRYLGHDRGPGGSGGLYGHGGAGGYDGHDGAVVSFFLSAHFYLNRGTITN